MSDYRNVGLLLALLAPIAAHAADDVDLVREQDRPPTLPEGVRFEAAEGGDATLVFDDPFVSKAEVTFDLGGRNIDFAQYDELHFDLLLEGGIVEPAVTLRGYPDGSQCRRWFYKRFPQVGSWQRVRLDLDLDDDRSLKRSKTPQQSLTIAFTRPEAQPDDMDAVATARIANVRLVRRPFDLTLDPRGVRTQRQDGRWRVVHPLVLRNPQDRPIEVALDVEGETLAAFEVEPVDETLTLTPGEAREVAVVLSVSEDRLGEMAAGHVERARVVAHLAGEDNHSFEPLRGYRPVYLYGIVPPQADAAELFEPGEPLTPDVLGELRGQTGWRFAVPTDVVPRYEDHFRCKACRFRLRARTLTAYYCANKDCERRGQAIHVEQDDPLFASYLSIHHKENARLAAQMARAYRQTGEMVFADTARRILLAYAEHYDALPMVSDHSTGFHARLSSATLFVKEPLLDFTQAYTLLAEAGAISSDELETVRDRLLVPMLYNVNLHHYGFSAGQVQFVLATLKAAAATERWWFFADALAGDAGAEVVLDRAFDDDGIGVEGGAYAESAAERLETLGRVLDRVGISVNQARIDQILRNSRAIGLHGDGAGTSVVLPNTGFTAVVQGEGPAWRRATINWGRSRERGEHDRFSFDFADPQGTLVNNTGRIAYGHPRSRFMVTTLAENVPVIDGGNVGRERGEQVFFHAGEEWAGCLVGDTDERRAYPGVRLHRALVLWRGVLLVVDDIVADAPRVIDLPVYGLEQMEVPGVSWSAAPSALSQTPPYAMIEGWRVSPRPVRDLQVAWSTSKDAQPALRMRYVGDACVPFRGEAVHGWTGEPRDMLMLRREAATWRGACVYESLRTEAPRVEAFEQLPAARGEAGVAGYRVRLADGRTVRVLISLDGAAYDVAGLRVDAEHRIAVSE